MCSAIAGHMCINSSRLVREFRKTPFQNQTHIKQVQLITIRMKMDNPQRSFGNTNTRHSLAELEGTGDPDGTRPPVYL